MNRTLTLAAAALALFAAGTVSAHQGAKGVVKQRMDAMKDTSERMKSMRASIDRGKERNAESLAADAEQIAVHAAEISKMFPEGSTSEVSEAKPEIWQENAEFLDLADMMARRAARVAEMARVGTEDATLQAAFAELGESCKSCHTKFRMKKQ
ncbi:c-type cytochrome [Tepidamorphus sp. 3E244]|uniref:c-type cytochrome n=1 Tax=Tepidamorphus sp. 3E244 TaxID=3385498 RepID=UPI0038FD1625